MDKYRNDVALVNKLFSPELVLLNPAISKNKRTRLLQLWADLNVEVVDLMDEAFVRSY